MSESSTVGSPNKLLKLSPKFIFQLVGNNNLQVLSQKGMLLLSPRFMSIISLISHPFHHIFYIYIYLIMLQLCYLKITKNNFYVASPKECVKIYFHNQKLLLHWTVYNCLLTKSIYPHFPSFYKYCMSILIDDRIRMYPLHLI